MTRSRFRVDILCEYAVDGLVELNRLWDQLAAKAHELDDVSDKADNSNGFTFQVDSILRIIVAPDVVVLKQQGASFLPVGSYRLTSFPNTRRTLPLDKVFYSLIEQSHPKMVPFKPPPAHWATVNRNKYLYTKIYLRRYFYDDFLKMDVLASAVGQFRNISSEIIKCI